MLVRAARVLLVFYLQTDAVIGGETANRRRRTVRKGFEDAVGFILFGHPLQTHCHFELQKIRQQLAFCSCLRKFLAELARKPQRLADDFSGFRDFGLSGGKGVVRFFRSSRFQV